MDDIYNSACQGLCKATVRQRLISLLFAVVRAGDDGFPKSWSRRALRRRGGSGCSMLGIVVEERLGEDSGRLRNSLRRPVKLLMEVQV